MGTEYVVFYSEASIVCILILTILLINDRLNSSKQETQVCFNRVITAFILYFASDAVWAAILGNVLPKSRLFVALINLSNYIIISLMAYEWFMYMAAAENMPFRRNRRKRFLWLLPMLVSIGGIVIAYAVDPYFWINENLETNMAVYEPAMIAAPIFYLLAAVVCSLINMRKTDRRDEKKQYLLIAIFPLGVMLTGILQIVILNAPAFCFGCTIMLVFFYIQHLQALISVDALTRLNNRGQINRYVEQAGFRENTRVCAMMIDIDRFKEINDTYGHAEGDRALILVAEALRQTCEKMKCPVFIGRYGGDEFVLILQNPGKNEEPEQAEAVLRGILAEKRKANHLLYELEISTGVDEMRDRNDTLKECLVRADAKLYEEKREKGTMR